jgi:hypothetical protein
MAQKTYQVIKNFKTPFVVATGVAHRPQQIKFKSFKKGDMVKGELKHANNKPAFVLVGGALVMPLDSIKEVVTKDIVSNATGDEKKTTEAKTTIKVATSKLTIMDSALVGALLGVVAVHIANKKNWIVVPEKINFLYGGLAGAFLGGYLVYRSRNK